MSTPEETAGPPETVGLLDAPNQQVVRPDGSAPWEEGTGGSTPEDSEKQLEDYTKAELLEKAQGMGVSPANNDMTKAELIDGIRAAGG